MIRIGLDVREIARPDSGIGIYVFNLVKALSEVDHQNRYFLFINANDETSIEALNLPANFSSVPVSRFAVDQLQDQLSLVRAMGSLKLHLFHVTHHDVTPLLARVPLVVTVHDIAPIDFPNPSWTHRTYYGLFSRLALLRATCILCDSTSTGRRIEARFPFCAHKWKTSYLGHDPYFRPGDDVQGFAEVSDRQGVELPYILYVGSFARRKNLPKTIAAFSIIREAKPALRFVIVGGHSGRDDIFPKELPEGVILAGRVSKRTLRVLYNRAELLLFTTSYEGFGVPVLEAMACGCPVVTSPVTSLPELGGDAALYASPDCPDQIASQALRLLTDRQLRDAMIQKGFEQVSRFNWEDTARQVLSMYQKTLRLQDGT